MVESAVMLDEDDDFVNPGPSDRTSTPNKTSGSDGSSSKADLKGISAAEVGSKIKTHEIGKKKVQQEQPKKKVKIAAKRNDKRTKPEKEKKVETRYTADIRRPATRMSPSRLCEAVRMMSNKQKNAIKEMGLGSLLGISIDILPGLLNYYLVDKLDAESDKILLEINVITITKDGISKIIGLSQDGVDMVTLPVCENDNPILVQWKSQYPGKKYIGKAYVESISRSNGEADLILRTTKAKWNIDNKLSNYTGPMLVLLLYYVYWTKYESISLTKGNPFIQFVNDKQLQEIETFELIHGGFRKQKLDSTENLGVDVAQNDEQLVDKEFADEEVI
ncbi:hypothetical protein LXL04_023366 [Taraxacum kok-saghyz]